MSWFAGWGRKKQLSVDTASSLRSASSSTSLAGAPASAPKVTITSGVSTVREPGRQAARPKIPDLLLQTEEVDGQTGAKKWSSQGDLLAMAATKLDSFAGAVHSAFETLSGPHEESRRPATARLSTDVHPKSHTSKLGQSDDPSLRKANASTANGRSAGKTKEKRREKDAKKAKKGTTVSPRSRVVSQISEQQRAYLADQSFGNPHAIFLMASLIQGDADPDVKLEDFMEGSSLLMLDRAYHVQVAFERLHAKETNNLKDATAAVSAYNQKGSRAGPDKFRAMVRQQDGSAKKAPSPRPDASDADMLAAEDEAAALAMRLSALEGRMSDLQACREEMSSGVKALVDCLGMDSLMHWAHLHQSFGSQESLPHVRRPVRKETPDPAPCRRPVQKETPDPAPTHPAP